MESVVDFDQVPFLSVSGQTLSLGRILRYLQLSGKLLPLLGEIVEQHIIYEEIQNRTDLDVTLAEMEQAAIDLRLKHQLVEPEQFQRWLASQGMDHTAFQNRVVTSLRLQKLIECIAAPNLPSAFEQQRHLLDQVDLFCFSSVTRELADQVKAQILSGETSFTQLLQTDKPANQELVSIVRGLTPVGKLPQPLRDVMPTIAPTDIIGPLPLEQRWCLFQVGAVVPAVLAGDVKKALELQLFQQWLAAKAQPLMVQLANRDRTLQSVS